MASLDSCTSEPSDGQNPSSSLIPSEMCIPAAEAAAKVLQQYLSAYLGFVFTIALSKNRKKLIVCVSNDLLQQAQQLVPSTISITLSDHQLFDVTIEVYGESMPLADARDANIIHDDAGNVLGGVNGNSDIEGVVGLW